MQGSSKRENLEQTLRKRLVAEIRRLQDFNRDLRGTDSYHKTHIIFYHNFRPRIYIKMFFCFFLLHYRKLGKCQNACC